MRFVVSTLFLFLAINSFAQSSRSIGFHLGIPIIHETLKEGRQYKPYQLLFYYNFTNLLKGKKNDLFIYLEPQLVWVHFSPKDDYEWEFGSNLGLEYRWNVSGQTAITAAIGSGPHFITVETRQQHRGFIFSDNFTAGLHQKLGGSGMNLDLKMRFRHISNLNFAKPNIGIDSWFVIAGLTKDLK
jgi:Lipid A 3-O-deacylase (PagL)